MKRPPGVVSVKCTHPYHDSADSSVDGTCSQWSCSYHIMRNGEVLHVASAADVFCAVWHDTMRFIDVVVALGGRVATTWEQVVPLMDAHPLFSPATDEEVEAATRGLKRILVEIETTTAK